MAAASAAAVLVASTVLAVTGVWLAGSYRPVGNPNGKAPGIVSTSLGLHDAANVVGFVGAVAAMGAGCFFGFLPLRSRWWLFGSGWVILAATVATMATWPVVQWDQLAISAPASPELVDGWWFAAFDDSVRFVFTDGSRIAPGQYRLSVLAHLLAPVLGFVASAVALRLAVRDLRQRDAPLP